MTGIRRPDDDPGPGHDPDTTIPALGGVPTDHDGASLELDHWLAELRVDSRRAERARRRTLVRAASEEATVHAALTDLAERGDVVAFDLAGDRLVRGIIRLVGTDVIVVRDGRTETVVRLDAVASFRLPPAASGRPGESGGRSTTVPLAPRPMPGATSLNLVRVLAALADTTPDVTLHRRDVRTAVTGTLVGIGVDVVEVRTRPAGTTYVPLWSVVDVSLTGSG